MPTRLPLARGPVMTPGESSSPSTSRGWLGPVASVVLVGGLGAAAWRWWPRGDEAPKLDTAVVDRGPIVSRVTATGALSALVTVQVGAQVTGRVGELLVDFNSKVKKG